MRNLCQYLSVKQIRQLHERYETHFSALALTAGFIFDSLTLRRIDLWAENAAILVFLFIAGLAIVLMHYVNTGWLREISVFGYQPFAQAGWWLPLVMQFAFGGLFSMFLVFYGRSGAIVANWPFFLLLVGLLVGNEVVRRYYRQLFFNTIVFYIAIFAYSVFAVPLIVGLVTWWVYIISSIVSLVLITLFIKLLEHISPVHIQDRKRGWIIAVGGIFMLMNLLYFLHVLPPIPLSLQQAEIAHSVQRLPNGNYQLIQQQQPWHQPVISDTTIHRSPGQPVYFFSSVFAPTDLTTEVTHRWQYRNQDVWITASEVTFPVVGGRDEGYRGYSQKQNVFPGKWRVIVAIEDGRILGRKNFDITYQNTTSSYKTSRY
jgi:hypothetical protein